MHQESAPTRKTTIHLILLQRKVQVVPERHTLRDLFGHVVGVELEYSRLRAQLRCLLHTVGVVLEVAVQHVFKLKKYLKLWHVLRPYFMVQAGLYTIISATPFMSPWA